jgi:membrane fusion protein (multidrug efflux system)
MTTARWRAGMALVLTVAGCGDGVGRSVAPELLAPATTAAPKQAVAEIGFVGVIVAGEWVEIEPKVEARIEEIFVKTGDQVRRGMPIARLDTQASEHELAGARAALQDARKRLGRRVRLNRDRPGVITAEEMDTARREVLQEQARVAKLNEARAEARVVAPFDGAIVERYLSPGALAGPNRPLVRLLGHGDVKVRFAVPEDRAHELTVGHPLQVRVDVGKGLGSAGSGVSAALAAHISAVNPEIDSSSRMVYAAATFEDAAAAAALSTGLIARVFPATGALQKRSKESRAYPTPASPPSP